MNTLKYTVIKTKAQYTKYCHLLEDLVTKPDSNSKNESELLTLLIEHYDKDNNSFHELNPVEIIIGLMSLNNLKSKDLAQILDLSKGTVSKIINYQKGLSKDSIRKLSNHFKISQEVLNQPYPISQTYKNVG